MIECGDAVAIVARARRGVGLFRTIFYVPALAPPVAATLGFVYLLNPATGPVNTVLRATVRAGARAGAFAGAGADGGAGAGAGGGGRRIPRLRLAVVRGDAGAGGGFAAGALGAPGRGPEPPADDGRADR